MNNSKQRVLLHHQFWSGKYITDKIIFLKLFCSLKIDWSLVSGIFCFSSCRLKGTGFERKIKLTFLRRFDNPLSEFLIFKIISYMQCALGYFPKFKRGLGRAFGAHFLYGFSIRIFSYLLLCQLIKFQCHTFFPSEDIKPNVLSSSYLDSWWHHKL